MLGDGKTSYDLAHDGEANQLGACSVSVVLDVRLQYLSERKFIPFHLIGQLQADKRRYQDEDYIYQGRISRRMSTLFVVSYYTYLTLII